MILKKNYEYLFFYLSLINKQIEDMVFCTKTQELKSKIHLFSILILRSLHNNKNR